MDRPLVQPWWRQRKFLWPLLGLLLSVAVGVCASVFQAERTLRIAADRAVLATVENGVFRDFIPLRGEVVPRDVVFVTALEGGSVVKVLVQPGDAVTEGQSLVELRNPDLEREVMASELSLIEQINALRDTKMSLEDNRLTAEQELADANYNLARLTRQAERQKYYFSKGITSAEERDKAVDELKHYQVLSAITAERNKRQEALRITRLPELQKSLAQLQKNLTDTRAKLDNLIVRAPAAGSVNLIELNVGQNCTRGEHIGDVTRDTGFKLAADVDEYYLSRVRKNQKADVDSNGRRYLLSVLRVYPQVKEGRFRVELGFDKETPAGLLAGQALQGKLQLGDDQPALVLPTGAFLEDTGGDWIFVLGADHKTAHRRHIKTGRRNIEQIEILSGLRAGEKALISDYRGFERIERIELTGSTS